MSPCPYSGSNHYSFTRSIYAPVRVSIRIMSPMLTNEGQGNSAPVSTLHGLVTFVAVLPFAPGSQYSTRQYDVVRRSQADRLVVVQHDVALHAFLEILPGVVDLIGGQFVLFVGLVVHEDELLALAGRDIVRWISSISAASIESPLL